MDGQGNYYFYGKKPGDTIRVRVPQKDNYIDELLKFQSGSENYIEKEFEIAAIVSRPLAWEQGGSARGACRDALMTGLIMTNEQMEENSGIIDYSFINIWSAGGCAAVFACIAAFKKSYRIEGYLLEVLP